MDAIHINWTKPFFIRHNKAYEIDDFEILTTILSALKWREKNGSIKMVTDSIGKSYYEHLGIESIWDGGIDPRLDSMPPINADIFWAAGKIYALKDEKAPVAMIDTDFIVWEKLGHIDADAAVIHREDIMPDIYPDPYLFSMKEGYAFDPQWDMTQKPCNTAFCIIQNRELLRYYTHQSIKFMENAQESDNFLTYMVFAEQRMLSVCAERLKMNVKEFSELGNLFNDNTNRMFTHTWGMKSQMRENEALRIDFCLRCVHRIKREYPHMIEILKKIDILKRYV